MREAFNIGNKAFLIFLNLFFAEMVSMYKPVKGG